MNLNWFKRSIIFAVLGCSSVPAATLAETVEYEAKIGALNSHKTGFKPSGTAHFKVEGDELHIWVEMSRTPPNIEHWEHFHGFTEGTESRCPIDADDANKDGFIDLVETGMAMGTTMVPFNHAPQLMDIPTDTYPKANAEGNYEYTKVVPLAALEKKFGETYKGASIDLDKRVFMVHGVPTSLKLPVTIQGQVGHFDTYTTLPIACGKIEKVR